MGNRNWRQLRLHSMKNRCKGRAVASTFATAVDGKRMRFVEVGQVVVEISGFIFGDEADLFPGFSAVHPDFHSLFTVKDDGHQIDAAILINGIVWFVPEVDLSENGLPAAATIAERDTGNLQVDDDKKIANVVFRHIVTKHIFSVGHRNLLEYDIVSFAQSI